MSEIKKNIETCRGEDVLAEVSALPQDPHFGSLVNEALDPLKQQALHQAGYDGYSEVIAQHKPYTFASAIIQMKSNLLLLLRALWQFPFGSGTLRSLSDDASLRSLADMWQHYITRLHGSETYGIPSRLSDLTDLPSAPLLLADRKISNLGNGIPDGATFARLVFDDTYAAANIRGIGDDSTEPWVLKKSVLYTGLEYVDFNISSINIPAGEGAKGFVHNCPNFTEAKLNNLVSVYFDNSRNGATYFLNACSSLKRVNIPSLQYIRVRSSEDGSTNILSNCTSLEDVSMPSLEEVRIVGGWYTSTLNFLSGCSSLRHVTLRRFKFFGFGSAYTQRCYANMMKDCPLLESVELGTEAGEITSGLGISTEQQQSFSGCPNLIDITIGGVGMVNCNFSLLSAWNPTNVLADADNTATFLQNFREHIALRLTANGSGKTLTLSQAVYDAIKDESHLFVFDEGTMTIYAYLTNIKHWTVTK